LARPAALRSLLTLSSICCCHFAVSSSVSLTFFLITLRSDFTCCWTLADGWPGLPSAAKAVVGMQINIIAAAAMAASCLLFITISPYLEPFTKYFLSGIAFTVA